MRISFDLDDTLTGYIGAKETGQRGFLAKLKYKEPIRSGTKAVFDGLLSSGHDVLIYTSSSRAPEYIKAWFRSYGIVVPRVINGEANQHVIKGKPLTKNPDAFEIDLHFDDENIVQDASHCLSCRLVVIDPCNADWVQAVFDAVRA